MTTITYIDCGLVIDGHAGDSEVCHGISAISQMVANYVTEKGWGDVRVQEGHLEIKNVTECGNDLFKAMSSAFRDIAEEYPENVKIVYE